MPQQSSVIITGASGALGSRIALKLAALFPGQYYLVLAARNTSNQSTEQLSSQLQAAGALFTWEKLDLSSLAAVNDFTDRVLAAIAKKRIPALYGLVNCAAIQMVPITKTVDGFDLETQTNVLAPMLLIQKLNSALEGGVVVNVSSSTHSIGEYDSFRNEHVSLDKSTGTVLSTPAALKKYGSTKLNLMMAGYALQRTERFADIQMVSADPGGMSGSSRLAPEGRLALKMAQAAFVAMGPLLRLFFPSAINPPEVPAAAFANIIHQAKEQRMAAHYVIGESKESSPLSRDETKQDEALAFVMEDLKKWL
ncbi:uncharacterized protein HMPREF1541_02994 [Cyphellophora europaea CBS 101466]|uniref:Ketoreductase (KR) domain-containing protein n=1 Tax=Cyphellophora europaea (strain CBS 101466) TaxID=1220924 RepID=W2RZF7_CYPE1|nr:uncharacterized protein HMPREF1541_02994 [Cyphellophora europaea CBS 101466]ETN41059.1 hypothetical protein HMPREF1541_02994 [Cyphellophora europaea CBS 101466]